MMDTYLDSAIIVKLYVKEVRSSDAIGLVGGCSAPYVLTDWQALEARNAIRLKTFRSEISVAEMTQSLRAFEQDIMTGRWVRPPYNASSIEQKAEELSAAYARFLGCRTLDIVHVAAALVIGIKGFLTFDVRQGALARRVGLHVKP